MTYDEFRALRRFPALDGLRAIAALMVVMFHFGGTDWRWLSGHSGVHIFFVLSGFLITTLALREEERSGRISFADFYVRRLFRIVPVYLVVLIAMAVYFAPPGQPIGDLHGGMPYYLTFMNEFSASGTFTISWTLGIEQKFYLLWPLAAFAAGAVSLGRRLGVTFGLIAAAAVAAALSRDLFIHYIPILLGCLLAILAHHPRGFAIIRPSHTRLSAPRSPSGSSGPSLRSARPTAPSARSRSSRGTRCASSWCCPACSPARPAPGCCRRGCWASSGSGPTRCTWCRCWPAPRCCGW
ncbi:acyltransferase family protein [Dactylosporangium darangshiense]|uniref:acyltransferase family protein n=1 Tax=Dactylosporangium darangshiense TaxID=579108 RepID=UPI003629131E